MISSVLASPLLPILAGLLLVFAIGRLLRPLNTTRQTRGWIAVATISFAVSVGTFGLFASAEQLTAAGARAPQSELRAAGLILVDCVTGDHYLGGIEGPRARIGTGGQPVRGGDLVRQACG